MAAIFSIYPTCIAYASTASVPVRLANYPDFIFYEYQYQNMREPLDLLPGDTTYLMDFANPKTSLWQVPAGKAFYFTANLPLVGGYVRLRVMKVGTGFILDEVIGDSFSYYFPPDSQHREYIIFITAQTKAQISDYSFFLTD